MVCWNVQQAHCEPKMVFTCVLNLKRSVKLRLWVEIQLFKDIKSDMFLSYD